MINLFSNILTQRRLQHSQWLSRAQIRDLQEKKLKRLIHYAYRHVPYYKALFDSTGLKPSAINSLDDLKKIPVTRKADLQVVTDRYRTSDRFKVKQLVSEHSSGSTGQPFTTYFDKRFVDIRNNMFLRALRNLGYVPGKKLMLITAGKDRSKPWLRWYYRSIENSPQLLVEQLNSIRPAILYGCTTPLRMMARYINENKGNYYQPDIVISTAETLDKDSRNLLQQTFSADVYDLYGLTEMGLVAWQCPTGDGYHLSEDTTIIEFEHDSDYNASRLIMTNLELTAMPLIRYQTGDIAGIMNEETCSCGRALRRINQIEGRMIDCIRLEDDSLVSPYRITLGLENIAGLGRYQFIQEDIGQYTIRLEKTSHVESDILFNIKKAMTPVLGAHARYSLLVEDIIAPPPGKKFRVVENKIR